MGMLKKGTIHIITGRGGCALFSLFDLSLFALFKEAFSAIALFYAHTEG